MDKKKRPVIISILNHKGGVAKTTTCLNLGAALAMRGKKVLEIDLDVQANLTHSLIGDLSEGEDSLCEALISESPFDKIIRPTSTENLFLIPAGESLIELDINLASMMGREQILKQCLQMTKGIENFDIILIDNPPYISLATVNSLVASDYYLVPVSCEYLPMVGLKWLQRTVQRVKKLNPNLKALGVAITMYDMRQGITKDVEELIREEMADQVFASKIRINTKFKATGAVKQTIFQYENDPKGKGTEDYFSLGAEVLERLNSEANL